MLSATAGCEGDLPQPTFFGHQLVDALADPRRVGDAAQCPDTIHVFANSCRGKWRARSYQISNLRTSRAFRSLAGQLLVLLELVEHDLKTVN